MKFDRLIELVGEQGWFDLATLVQLADERRESLCMQLHRWCASGKVLALRRGMYALAERYRRGPLHAAELANVLHAPSYLSGEWALGYYGLIPERVVTYTSVTTKAPRQFENAFGVFAYRHVKPAAFFGYRGVQIEGRRVVLATAEKALLDLWYLSSGDWSAERIAEMRFQNIELIRSGVLRREAPRLASPRVRKAASTFLDWVVDHREEGIEL